MTKAIAVVGSEDFVLGFQLAGVKRAERADTPDALAAVVDHLLSSATKDIGILIVNAKDVITLPASTRRKLTESIDPVVIQMGGESGDLREKVKRAIGIDLYKD